MDKKLYVLRSGGKKPGIYLEWLSFFEQIDCHTDVDCLILSYRDEGDGEEEDETVPHSRKWAFRVARDFLAGKSGEEESGSREAGSKESAEEASENETTGNEEADGKQMPENAQDEEEFDEAAVEWSDAPAPEETWDSWETAEEEESGEAQVTQEALVEKTLLLRDALKKVIIGQDEAIDKLERAFFHREKKIHFREADEPRGVYLFAGPPGVGKTFMAETFAEALGMAYRRFDMSGFASINSMEELVGVSTLYTHAKQGVLTKYVDEHPESVLLLDEIEKAHIDVIRLLLQILDEGVCNDRYLDRNVSFRGCMIIMTTNAGKQLYTDSGNENLSRLSDQVVMDALLKDINPEKKTPYFPPEIVSRMAAHTIIMFNHLKADSIRRVIRRDVEQLLADHREKYDFDIARGKNIVAATVQYAGGGGDARNAARLAGKLIDRELYELFTLLREKQEKPEECRLKQVSWECDLTDCTEEVKTFYVGERDGVVPVLKETQTPYTSRISDRVEVRVVNTQEAFLEIIRKEKVVFAVIDYAFGRKEKEISISIADAKTIGGAAFLESRRENADIPVYLLKNGRNYRYSESEERMLLRNGAEGFLEEDCLTEQLDQAYADVCCRKAVELLTLRHQVLTYATRKQISENGSSAKIIFYDMKLEMAVEAEDKGALLSEELRPDKRWEDIFVSPEVREELEFFIGYLKKSSEYVRTGARIPRGVLMFGPPGTGKTSLAKVVAAESGVNFLSVGADELRGGGAEKVHALFRTARKYAPAVLFIDEIDAIGIARTGRETNAVLNALLTEMDGFKRVDAKPVFVMAATNIHGMDAALLRRFDRTFVVDLPGEEGRRWMLKRLFDKHKELLQISEEELESIVSRSEGLSPADLENIVEAALREGIRSGRVVGDAILDESFEKSLFGESRRTSSEKELLHTAYHEAGHAVVELYYGRVPEYLSVIARGSFNGYVQQEAEEEHPTKERLLQRICSGLGGRAAEQEFGYGLTPGAAADLKNVTGIAKKMVCEYGMYGEEAGLAVLTEEEYRTDERAKALVNSILQEQLTKARTIVREKQEAVRRIVDNLQQNEQKYLTRRGLLAAYRGE